MSLKSIISPAGIFGGFREVTTLDDAYEADGCIYPFNVLGEPHSIGVYSKPADTPEELATARAVRKEYIITKKIAANKTNFPHGGKQVEHSDPAAGDLDAMALYVALNNSFPVGFPNAWKATDGTWIPVPNIPAFKELYNSKVNQGLANFTKSETLQAQIDAATTVEDINLIDW